MTVIEKETMNAIIRMSRCINEINKSLIKRNELLEELISVLKEKEVSHEGKKKKKQPVER